MSLSADHDEEGGGDSPGVWGGASGFSTHIQVWPKVWHVWQQVTVSKIIVYPDQTFHGIIFNFLFLPFIIFSVFLFMSLSFFADFKVHGLALSKSWKLLCVHISRNLRRHCFFNVARFGLAWAFQASLNTMLIVVSSLLCMHWHTLIFSFFLKALLWSSLFITNCK